MSVDEFLNFPSKNVIYEVSSDDKIIEELVGVFNSKNANESNETDNVDENDDKETVEIGRQLKQTDSLENFIRKKKISSIVQTNIDMYFH
ncbi:25153_t:CDS:2 [Cetraspora pellucida]|uniref:25153_t:CDS:1 n=1 Tax=Cetraspora pellucida TaxID=1433469 RepID=A0A9N9N8T5_9GLOM|nr:25153_t:CDS:2 [Cetraspora pellucida]